MEPADKPFVDAVRKKGSDDATVIEFLPDADEIERRPLPRYARITLYALITMLVTFLLWASLVEVEEIVVARGRLATPSSNIIVQPLETSIIQGIDVRVGQVVKKGERLATLDPTFADADRDQLRTRLQSLQTQIHGIEAELAGSEVSRGSNNPDGQLQAKLSAERQANYKAQQVKLDENIARLRAGLETNRRDQEMLTQRVKSLREIEAMQERLLAQQFGARASYLSAQEKRLEVERDLQLTRYREQEIKRELAGAEAERSAFAKGWRQKLMEDLLNISRDRDAINEQLQKAEKRHKLITLTAPSDAVVLSIAKLSQGSVIREAEQMFTLVPLGTELEAEVQIDSVDIGYIKVGEAAHVKFDAFPYQRHGTVEAKVRTISEDAFRRDTPAANQGTDAYYLSQMALGEVKLRNMTDRSRLLPGMTLTAEIVVGKRKVISYLVWPLTRALDEAIREP